MPQVEIAFIVPYFLRLENGEYPSQLDGKEYEISLEGADNAKDRGFLDERTRVSSLFSGTSASDDDIQRAKSGEVDRLLRQVNRLLRWYRATTGRAVVTELTRAQASPFLFRVVEGEGDVAAIWSKEITFEPSPVLLSRGQSVGSITESVRSGFASKNDPDVSTLFLLDADQALREGRFKEAVLFCWSAIDSTFSQKYKKLVYAVIEDKDEREAFVNFRNAK